MTLLLVTFAVALTTIFGSYWFFVLRLEERDKASAVSRLRSYRTESTAAGVVRSPDRLSNIPWLESMLARQDGMTRGIRRLLDEAGLQINVGTFVLACFVGAAAGFFIGWGLLQLLAMAVLLAVLGGAAPYAYVRFKRSRRLAAFEEQFPEAMDLIARALRAGHAFSTGLAMVADEMQPPVGAEFRRLADEHKFGRDLADALKGMAERVPLLDARFFVTAVLTQREAGGNLSEVLDNLASVMRERFKLKRQIRVITAHGRISAWVLAAVPPTLALAMFFVSPDLMRTLITDPLGIQLVVVATILQITGTIMIARMVRVEY